MQLRVWLGVLLGSWPGLAASIPSAGGPATLRTTPPAGITIADKDRHELEEGAAALANEIVALRRQLSGEDRRAALLPDVEIFHKAVDWALRYDEFFRSNEVALARTLLQHGQERARRLAQGDPFWLTRTGLVVRGYRSRIDQSVQPYGLVVPTSFPQDARRSRRLDVWLHGRDDRLTELKFIGDRLRSYGEFVAADTFVLHPYGRFCNAFKFAGETDVFEALESARQWYAIDDDRLGLRGFSMGGAGVWHLAVHHPGVWAAAAPGAGFAETADYTGALMKDPKPAWWEQRLWKLYDATGSAANFHNLPVIAYSGALDKQKQAADVMARAMRNAGLELEHLIGPGVGHKYEPGTKAELARKFDRLMAQGRNPAPTNIVLATSTLRYARSHWLAVEGLERSWEPAFARVEASAEDSIQLFLTNVARISLNLAQSPCARAPAVSLALSGKRLQVTRPSKATAATNWTATFEKTATGWQLARARPLSKRPGLQGPVDDAFYDRFVVVRPIRSTRPSQRELWIESELARFTNEWRAQFRGDVQVLDARHDVAIRATAADAHWILWGDPASNPVLGRMLPGLPIKWDAREVCIGTNCFDGATHAPVFIFPNPEQPSRYVVVNSGPTFFAAGAGSNAQQTPKLPDLAVINFTAPQSEWLTKGVVLAGFFDEDWRWPDGRQQR